MPQTQSLTFYDELPIVVLWRLIHPGHPGRTYGPPELCFPAEPPEFELVSVQVFGGELPLDNVPAPLRERLEEAIQDELPSLLESERADAAEARAEARRDSV